MGKSKSSYIGPKILNTLLPVGLAFFIDFIDGNRLITSHKSL